jgi:hypothetical protein
MDIRKPKTLADFPKFMVAALRRGETSVTGYTRFELEGHFDRIIEQIDPSWFWIGRPRQPFSLVTRKKSQTSSDKLSLT